MNRKITHEMLSNPPNGGILSEIHSFLKNMKYPDYRYRQLVHSLQNGVEYFDDINELPINVRETLKSEYGQTPLPLSLAEIHASKQVEKVLFQTQSGYKIETVLSHYRKGWKSICISSQSGCGLGCTFCATAAMGLMKNISVDEICAQVFHPYWKYHLPNSISFMGMGEALANPNTLTAIDVLTNKAFGGISSRRITVSTVGFAPNLESLINQFPQVTITLSVHSPFSEQRAELIPLEKRFSLRENLKILDKYVKTYKRKVYLAYLLIVEVNDSKEHLNGLINLIKSQARSELYHVSVIRYNPAFGANPLYQQPTLKNLSLFVQGLNEKGIHATRRTQFGSEIDAACGQLHATNENYKVKK
ncbi:radical SAM protein [Echinicola shivajiensis]|uniref:radical SAM protein n=1 Tax=Echinicola shivajiensis TaxID=1035916 RepID=UPI001BFC7C84|nr:radical SAM protein [Echinicola shivajiensis]